MKTQLSIVNLYLFIYASQHCRNKGDTQEETRVRLLGALPDISLVSCHKWMGLICILPSWFGFHTEPTSVSVFFSVIWILNPQMEKSVPNELFQIPIKYCIIGQCSETEYMWIPQHNLLKIRHVNEALQCRFSPKNWIAISGKEKALPNYPQYKWHHMSQHNITLRHIAHSSNVMFGPVLHSKNRTVVQGSSR